MMTIPTKSLAVLCTLVVAAGAAAQAIPDRATLNSILGANFTLDDFESYFVSGSGAAGLGTRTLDYRTVVRGLGNSGPGLVAIGATYSVPSGSLAWMGRGFGNFTSKSIGPDLFNGGRLDITYVTPVAAMGVDVGGNAALPGSGQAIFKDGAGAVLGTVPFSVTSTPQFVGFQSAAGIGSVELTMAAATPFTPMIDDHAYALDQGQLARDATFGTGCNAVYASFYENHNAFDLSNSSIEFTNNGSHYLVTRGTTPVAQPTTAPVTMGNVQVLPFALGWTFPYLGSTTNTLYVSSDGFVHLAPNTQPSYSAINLLNSGPILAAKLTNLQPAWGGTVTFETDAVAGTATVTFDQVVEAVSGTPANTFQYYFDSTGRMEVRYGACARTRCRSGWSLGAGVVDPGSIDISSTLPITVNSVDILDVTLANDARPVLGTTINLTMFDVPSGSPLAAYVYGLSRVNPGVSLGSLGGPGCWQYVTPDSAVLSLNPAGTITSAVPIPPMPGLAGLNVYAQGAVFGPVGVTGSIGVLTSNGIELLINLL